MKFIIEQTDPFKVFKTKEEASLELKKMRSHMFNVYQNLDQRIKDCEKLIENINNSRIPEFDWLITYKEVSYLNFIDYKIHNRKFELSCHIDLCKKIKKMIDDIAKSYGPDFILFFERVNSFLEFTKVIIKEDTYVG